MAKNPFMSAYLSAAYRVANTARGKATNEIKRQSKPGLRRYVGATEIPRVLGGLGISILSTPQGIVSGREAKKQNIGGELLAVVW